MTMCHITKDLKKKKKSKIHEVPVNSNRNSNMLTHSAIHHKIQRNPTANNKHHAYKTHKSKP